MIGYCSSVDSYVASYVKFWLDIWFRRPMKIPDIQTPKSVFNKVSKTKVSINKLTVSCLVMTPASMADLFMSFRTSKSGASMKTTYGRNSDVRKTLRACGSTIMAICYTRIKGRLSHAQFKKVFTDDWRWTNAIRSLVQDLICMIWPISEDTSLCRSMLVKVYQSRENSRTWANYALTKVKEHVWFVYSNSRLMLEAGGARLMKLRIVFCLPNRPFLVVQYLWENITMGQQWERKL